MKKAYFASAVAERQRRPTSPPIAPIAHPVRDAHFARQCSIEAQFKAGVPYCFGSVY